MTYYKYFHFFTSEVIVIFTSTHYFEAKKLWIKLQHQTLKACVRDDKPWLSHLYQIVFDETSQTCSDLPIRHRKKKRPHSQPLTPPYPPLSGSIPNRFTPVPRLSSHTSPHSHNPNNKWKNTTDNVSWHASGSATLVKIVSHCQRMQIPHL